MKKIVEWFDHPVFFGVLLVSIMVILCALLLETADAQPDRTGKKNLTVEKKVFLLRPVQIDGYRKQSVAQKQSLREARRVKRAEFFQSKRNNRSVRVIEVEAVKQRKDSLKSKKVTQHKAVR